MGFSGLKNDLEGISSKMLSESLSSLEEQGLVARTIVSDQPSGSNTHSLSAGMGSNQLSIRCSTGVKSTVSRRRETALG
nr:winged helix-turn-helix transcriptional regulator [Haloarcula sp. GH36]